MYYRFTHDEGKDCCFPPFVYRGGGFSVSLSLSFRIGSSTGKETASRYSERAWVDLEVGEVGGEMKV